ncbi:hypothetical protein EJ02DRAFT_401644 [Clathrospora elynae]|uniref:Heterokaryon incompatibility domain-containing protein n=1 Tax=Clathrospora elynae TaxID=706981 RepID=A0A6A5SQ84_9PLEO|nr:hypothetical protein EJ02DRAFT_401644 [Clathrospora elynae]
MTRAIQDAVTTARAVAIRYLWVDALCIIQGDVKDRTNESKRISLVYANAFVTLCALTGSSYLESFLDRNPAITFKFGSNTRPTIQRVCNLRHQHLSAYQKMKHYQDPRTVDSILGAAGEACSGNFRHEMQQLRQHQDYKHIYERWYTLAGDYSSRKLTDVRDKFPAISGLAALLAAETGDEFIARLWESHLLYGLL